MPTFEAAPFQIIDGDRGTNYPSKEDFSPLGHCLFRELITRFEKKIQATLARIWEDDEQPATEVSNG